jgi:hypothetical protein
MMVAGVCRSGGKSRNRGGAYMHGLIYISGWRKPLAQLLRPASAVPA